MTTPKDPPAPSQLSPLSLGATQIDRTNPQRTVNPVENGVINLGVDALYSMGDMREAEASGPEVVKGRMGLDAGSAATR